MEVATGTNFLEMNLFIVIFSFLLSFIGSSLYHHLNAIKLITTDKLLLGLTKYSVSISAGLIHLAKRHYRFFVVNKIFIVLAQIFIYLSGVIIILINDFLDNIV